MLIGKERLRNFGRSIVEHYRHTLLWKFLLAFLALAILPLGLAGMLVAYQLQRVYDQAEGVSSVYERRAATIASKVASLLYDCEGDLKELAELPRTDQSYTDFANRHRRQVWVRTGTNDVMREARPDAMLYKEVSFIDSKGQEQVLVVRGLALPPGQRRNVSNPLRTTYRSETYFQEAQKLSAGQFYVSHLSGFHVNRIEQLGIEKIIPRLKHQDPRDKLLYRYILYELMRAAGEVEYVNSFQEEDHTILVYRAPGDTSRILVEFPGAMTSEELRARQLELIDLLAQLAPEDVVEGARYDGVIRFAMPVFDAEGGRLGVVMIALDHLHLRQITQHVKAMEEDATVFAGYRDADYTYLFDDEGWILTHPQLWKIRGVTHRGQPLPAYNEKTTKSEYEVGHTPVNLLELDWKLGAGYHKVVTESRLGRTGLATSTDLSGVLSTRVYSPIFYSTGPYSKYGIFGGVMMGTRVDTFIGLMRAMSESIGEQTEQVRTWVIVAFLIVLLIVSLLSILLARQLVNPIRRLSAIATKIGSGELDTPVPFMGKDEVGELARSFQEMTVSLKTTIQELKQRNLELKEAQNKLLLTEKEKRHKLQRELAELRQEIARSSFANMVSVSPQMEKIREEIVRVSKSSATVLVVGENGTGKELVAEAIHRNSPRRDKKFVRINCSAFNDNLLESELFGHVKGSFTGASGNRQGLFESANGGTLLLDEVGDMSLEMQKRLLRTLQEGEVVPLGSNQVITVDVRILAATNKDLPKQIREGRFREDLYHRLNVIQIRVPPLRERKEDILPLANYFLQKFCEEDKQPLMTLDAQAERFLMDYRWPGNVRELSNAIERAVIRSRGEILRLDDFQMPVEDNDFPGELTGVDTLTLDQVEKNYILGLLEKNGGNKKLTAEQLAIGYNTLWRKLKQYGREL
jgi:DNA-binding NtrC family response regulator